jgi:CHAT domain-containing protein
VKATVRRAVICTLLSIAIPGAFADTEADVTAVVRRFHDAYTAGDIAAARALWSPSELGTFDAIVAREMRVQCMRPRHVEVTRVSQAPDGLVTAEVESEIVVWSSLPNAVPSIDSAVRKIELRRENEQWRIARWRTREEELVEHVKALSSPALLREATSKLRTPRLAMQLSRYAVQLINQRRFDEAELLIATAEAIAREHADDAAFADAMSVRGVLRRVVANADPAEALAIAEESVALAERSGSPDVLGRTLQRFGRAKQVATGIAVAEPFQRVLDLADHMTDVTTLGHAASQLARHHDDRGERRVSLRLALVAAKYATESGDAAATYSATMNLAGAYLWQGDPRTAIGYFERGLKMAKEAGWTAFAADVLAHIARCYLAMDDVAAGARAIDEGFCLAASGRDSVASQAMRELYVVRADNWLASGLFDRATADVQAAIAETEATHPHVLSGLWAFYARIPFEQKRYGEALEYTTISEDLAGPQPQSLSRAQIARRVGRIDEAETALTALIDDVDRLRAIGIGGAQQRDVYVSSRAEIYDELADLLVDRDRARDAVQVTERRRARVLLESVLDDNRGAADHAERLPLERKVEQLNSAMLAADGARREQLRIELASARKELDQLSASTSKDPRIESRRQLPPLETLGLPADMVLIEFLATRQRTIAFTITFADGGVQYRATPIPVDRKTLRLRVGQLRNALEHRDLRYDQFARNLYNLLLAPLGERVARAKSIGIIPDDVLWNVPFHALQGPDGRYLAEKQSIFYAPSLHMLALTAAPRTQARRPVELLAFANPVIGADTAAAYRSVYRDAELGSLPDTETEVRALQRIYGPGRSRVYIGADARESVLKSEASRSRILHIATHGIVDEAAPMYSSVVLAKAPEDAEDGLLEAREIAAMRLDADLAVLSACDTARGRIGPGEGVVGLSWSLLAAGVPRSVVSQWKAESASTSELMIEFHRQLVAGQPAADALRAAQRKLMHDRRRAHPFYWAPFVVVGGR